MHIWDNRTKEEIKRDNQAMFQFITLVSCIIAVIYMVYDSVCL